MSIQAAALQKALAFLKASGAEYVVEFQGDVHQSANTKFVRIEEKPVKKRQRLHHFDRDTGYLIVIKSLKVGDVARFCRKDYPVLASDVAWTNFKPSVQTAARYTFGPDNFVYQVSKDDDYVEVMRVE